MKGPLAALGVFLSFLSGMLIGYHAGRESMRRQMVVCEDKKQADQPGIYLCLPANWRTAP